MLTTPSVTVIIPAYNNWKELSKCIAGCIAHIHPHHRIVIIDDGSDEPLYRERIAEAIRDHSWIQLVHNDRRLGFVATCNRGVRECVRPGDDILLLNADTEVTEGFLDEMLACLHASDRHGVVCPRSNSATICTIPFQFSGDRTEFRTISFNSWRRLKDSFPLFSVIPTGVGFCMLIRRELVDRFGLFDAVYGYGYNEENDFSCRINRMGYSAIMANRAYVFHSGGGGFSSKERTTLEKRNRRILLRRYPEYGRAVKAYCGLHLPAREHFADVLGGCYPRKKILYDLSHLIAAHNGTSEYALSLLDALYPILSASMDVTILIHPVCEKFFRLSEQYPRVLLMNGTVDKRFDLALVPQQTFIHSHLEMLNRLAVRWIVNIQDVIALRCNELKTPEADSSLRFVAKYADGILSVSRASLEDCQAFLGADAFRSDGIRRAIHHGYPVRIASADTRSPMIPREPFLFLVGNHYEHKAIARAIDALPEKILTVVLGEPPRRGSFGKNLRFLPSGKIDPAIIAALYRECQAVIFPSQYEGFGLPMLHAAQAGKPVIACDTATTREIVQAFKLEKIVSTFRNFEEIGSLIARVTAIDHVSPTSGRTWHDAAVETAAFIDSVLVLPVNLDLLEERSRLLREIGRIRSEQNARSFMMRMRSFVARCIKKGRRVVERLGRGSGW